jgi:hypothetical protein
MATDFDDYEDDEWEDIDDELTPEEIADIRRDIQDANLGFAYEMVDGEDGGFAFKCGKCGRVASIHERPFPHKLNCPMKRYNDDED